MSKCPRSSCAFFMNRFFFCSFFQVSLALSDLFSNTWCIKKAFLGFSVDFFQQCVTTRLNANFFLHIFEYFNSIINPVTTRGGTKFLPLIKMLYLSLKRQNILLEPAWLFLSIIRAPKKLFYYLHTFFNQLWDLLSTSGQKK